MRATVHRPHTSRTPSYAAPAVPTHVQTHTHAPTRMHTPPTHPHTLAPTHTHNNTHAPRLNEVFVGDLSFFCAEDDLLRLFSTHGQVVSVRIVRSDENNRSRTFGFVGMGSVEEARHVANLLHGRLFMGRYMKVELTAFKHAPRRDKDAGYEVHVAFTAAATVGQLNEVLLRKVFIAYGTITDVVVRDYHINEQSGEQTGYGFATFPDLESALSVIQRCSSFFPLPGLHLRCTPGHRVQACLRERAQWELLREQRERERELVMLLKQEREFLERQRYLQHQQQQREALLAQERESERERERMHWTAMHTHTHAHTQAPLFQRSYTTQSAFPLSTTTANMHVHSFNAAYGNGNTNTVSASDPFSTFSPSLSLPPSRSLSVSSSPPLPLSLASSPVEPWRVEKNNKEESLMRTESAAEEQEMIEHMFFNFLS